jgi:hypothetical protein
VTYSGSPRFNRRMTRAFLGLDRPLLAQREAVRADHAEDLVVLGDQLPVQRRRRIQMRRGPVAAAAG